MFRWDGWALPLCHIFCISLNVVFIFQWGSVENSTSPVNTIRWPDAGSMLGHYRRRWLNIEPALVCWDDCAVFSIFHRLLSLYYSGVPLRWMKSTTCCAIFSMFHCVLSLYSSGVRLRGTSSTTRGCTWSLGQDLVTLANGRRCI